MSCSPVADAIVATGAPNPPNSLPAGFVAPCLPTKAPTPSGAEWMHEIKLDGFRIIARKNGERVRL
jgi:bifunctional non-homologous end joining protein LigD